MEKLELKHFAPYLPFGLTVFLGTTQRNIIAVSTDTQFVFVDAYKGSRDKQMAGIENIKPIFHPLSDLTKEIEHNGERFVPLKRITKEYYDPNNETIFEDENLFKIVDNKYCYPSNNKKTSHWWLSYNEKRISFDEQEVESTLPQYELLQKLFEWHFDVFGLIDKGLAIDINTLIK